MAETLISLLARQVERRPDAPYCRFMENGELVGTLSYQMMWDLAGRWAALLQEKGLRKGEPVFIVLPNTASYPGAFFGSLLASGIPVSTSSLRGKNPKATHLEMLASRMKKVQARFLILPPEQAEAVRAEGPISSIEGLQVLTQLDVEANVTLVSPICKADDLALLQFTSGTSGNAKAVQLSHGALSGQALSITRALKLHDPEEDWAVSWLPLYHDMGLIGFLLTPLVIGGHVTFLRTEEFIMNPSVWPKALASTQASITGGPPSAYSLCARSVREPDTGSLDLRRLRIALVGAETVSRGAMEQFSGRFANAGFAPTSFVPCYGLAENGVAVTITPPSEGPKYDLVDRKRLDLDRIAEPAESPSKQTCEIVSVGVPLEETDVAIMDEEGRTLPERSIGEVVIQSPTLMKGYYNDPEATSEALGSDGLRTGDLGYLAEGRLYVTGRKKELLIVGGVNYSPEHLEMTLHAVLDPGMRTAVISYFDPQKLTESIVALVETKQRDKEKRERLRWAARRELRNAGYPVSEIVLVSGRRLPTTASGKLKRLECRSCYLDGAFNGND